LRSSSYQKLSCTPYNGNKPAPLPQKQDQDNWDAFQSATESLVSDLNFVGSLSYGAWITFNRDCIDQVGSTITPDRRQVGDVGAVPPSFYAPYGPAGLVAHFMHATAGFMNLCDDLKALAAGLSNVQSSNQWNDLLNFLTNIVMKDVFIDYAKPTAGALLTLCSEGGVQVSSTLTEAKDSSSLTCTVTIA
jgi:hypothetical protein